MKTIALRRITTVALGRGESITEKVREVTRCQGASVFGDLTPAGIDVLEECIRNLEGGGRVSLVGANSEPLNLSE